MAFASFRSPFFVDFPVRVGDFFCLIWYVGTPFLTARNAVFFLFRQKSRNKYFSHYFCYGAFFSFSICYNEREINLRRESWKTKFTVN